MAWSEDAPKRFAAYGWDVARVEDGNDLASIERAIAGARTNDKPSLIAVRTHIGFGSPNKQDTQKAHGSPLGEDEVRLTKEAYGWDPDQHFLVPPEVAELMGRAVDEGDERVGAWEQRRKDYATAFPDEARELAAATRGELRGDAFDGLKTYPVGEELATRQASQQAIQALGGPVPELFGGSADLSESNLTLVKDAGDFGPDDAGRNLWFGVREHAMGGAVNGIAYHGGVHPVRGHVPQLQRLHARQRSARGARRSPRDLRLDARLGRARRGRADPPADRALRGAAGDAEPVVRPPGRRQRGRGRVARRRRAAGRPGGARAHAPEAPDARGHARARPRRRGARRLRPRVRAAIPSS